MRNTLLEYSELFDEEDDVPHLKITHSMLIRLFTYFNEMPTTHEDVFEIADIISALGADGHVISIDDYDDVTGSGDDDDEDY